MSPPLAAGDAVEVTGTEEPDAVGTVLSDLGDGTFAVQLEDGRTAVLQEHHLCGRAPQPGGRPAGPNYSIVGTWDNWLGSEMIWNASLRCLEYDVTIGEEGTESFKFVVDDDWERCVHPDCCDANPHIPHKLQGPDEQGMSEEWTIGVHHQDEAVEGKQYKVRLFLSADGSPESVTWAPLLKEPPPRGAPAAPSAAARVGEEQGRTRPAAWTQMMERPAEKVAAAQQEAGGPPSEREAEAKREQGRARPAAGPAKVAPPQDGARKGRRAWEAWMVVQPETRSDGSDDQEYCPQVVDQNAEMEERVADNLRRYRQEMMQNTRTAMDDLKASRRKPTREDGNCMECGSCNGKVIDALVCCDECWDKWGELRKQGWDPSVFCSGTTAGSWAERLAADGSFSRKMARIYIMGQCPGQFRP